MKKAQIELSPYDALQILRFLREFVNGDTKGVQEFTCINRAVDNYESEIYKKVSDEMLDDAIAEAHVNILLGYFPPTE
jgi:hypothetical protein